MTVGSISSLSIAISIHIANIIITKSESRILKNTCGFKINYA
jgi:hypothetical protein